MWTCRHERRDFATRAVVAVMRTAAIWFFSAMIVFVSIGIVVVVIAAIRDPDETWESFWDGPGGWR